MRILKPDFIRVSTATLEGCEGPVFDVDGKFYAVAPMGKAPDKREDKEFIDGIGGKLYEINIETGDYAVVCVPHFDGYGGRPAGCQSDGAGSIWIADMRLGLLKWQNGKCIQISKVDSDGNALQGANDLVFDDQGNLWFTGPGSKIAPAPEDRINIFKEAVGCIYCLPKGETKPIKVDDGFVFCNGIAVKNDLLLVAETVPRKIIAYDIKGPGKISNRRVWGHVPKELAESGGPDGMDFDIKGQLLVANHGAGYIEVYPAEESLEPIARIKCPFDQPSNLHFKPGTKTCFVTEHDQNAVWRFDWENEGMPMYCDKV